MHCSSDIFTQLLLIYTQKRDVNRKRTSAIHSARLLCTTLILKSPLLVNFKKTEQCMNTSITFQIDPELNSLI